MDQFRELGGSKCVKKTAFEREYAKRVTSNKDRVHRGKPLLSIIRVRLDISELTLSNHNTIVSIPNI